MLDWLGKMLDLPKEFLTSGGGKGGGVIQVISTVSIDATASPDTRTINDQFN